MWCGKAVRGRQDVMQHVRIEHPAMLGNPTVVCHLYIVLRYHSSSHAGVTVEKQSFEGRRQMWEMRYSTAFTLLCPWATQDNEPHCTSSKPAAMELPLEFPGVAKRQNKKMILQLNFKIKNHLSYHTWCFLGFCDLLIALTVFIWFHVWDVSSLVVLIRPKDFQGSVFFFYLNP